MYNYAVETATDFYQIVPGCVRCPEALRILRLNQEALVAFKGGR